MGQKLVWQNGDVITYLLQHGGHFVARAGNVGDGLALNLDGQRDGVDLGRHQDGLDGNVRMLDVFHTVGEVSALDVGDGTQTGVDGALRRLAWRKSRRLHAKTEVK